MPPWRALETTPYPAQSAYFDFFQIPNRSSATHLSRWRQPRAPGILTADLPGVSMQGLDVRVDNDTLLIDGDATQDMPEGMEAVHAELRTRHFRLAFALSRELDTTRIDAKLEDGVLTVTIPKAETAKPHRIEVRGG